MLAGEHSPWKTGIVELLIPLPLMVCQLENMYTIAYTYDASHNTSGDELCHGETRPKEDGA